MALHESRRADAGGAVPPARGLPGWARWSLPALIVLVVLAAFAPALGASFVNWDDEAFVVDNPRFRGLSGEHLRWMWTHALSGPYMPLSWMSLALDHALWGLGEGLAAPEAPRYHLTNVLLHALGALAFYVLARRLLERALPGVGARQRALGAALAALVFAAHPLRVESVAWVTERRDVLSGLFFVLAIAAYVKASPRGAPRLDVRAALLVVACAGLSVAAFLAAVELGPSALGLRSASALAAALGLAGCSAFLATRAARHDGASGRAPAFVAAFVLLLLAFLSKALGVTLPLALLVIDLWPLRRWTPGAGARAAAALLIEKVPLLALSLVFGVLAVWGQRQYPETMLSLEQHGLPARIAQAFYALWFYPSRTLLPHDLIPMVELPDELSLAQGRFLLPALVVVGGAAALVLARRRLRAALVACVVFVLLLAPVSGLAQAGAQLVADRYSYLPCMPFALLAGGAWVAWRARATGRVHVALASACAFALVLVLGGLTWRQTRHWRSSEALWTHMSAVAPHSGLPHLLLGMLRYREAQESQGPQRPALIAEARRHFEEGRRKDPTPIAMYQKAYGAVLIEAGAPERAVPALGAYLAVRPEDYVALTNLGVALIAVRRFAEAAEAIERALGIEPGYTRGWLQLGTAYEGLGDAPNAIRAYERVVTDWPRYEPAKQRLRALRGEEWAQDQAQRARGRPQPKGRGGRGRHCRRGLDRRIPHELGGGWRQRCREGSRRRASRPRRRGGRA